MNAVLVIDMTRGFLDEGCPLYCGAAARRIVGPVEKLLARETAAGSKVFFLGDRHAPGDLEFQMFPPHCVAGFGVDSYISGARPVDFTADLHELAGRPIAKRGRTPGLTANPRLRRVL